jgi:predicted GNAT superfamily acetyltransferase
MFYDQLQYFYDLSYDGQRALGNGIQLTAWTFDELYGRDSKFLTNQARGAGGG